MRNKNIESPLTPEEAYEDIERFNKAAEAEGLPKMNEYESVKDVQAAEELLSESGGHRSVKHHKEAVGQRSETKERKDLQHFSPDYTVEDIVKQYSPERYDFQVMEASVPFEVYEKTQPKNARELYKIAFSRGRVSIAVASDADQLDRLVKGVEKKTYIKPPADVRRHVFGYCVTAFLKSQANDRINADQIFTPLDKIFVYNEDTVGERKQ